jgi:hypothetical protein
MRCSSRLVSLCSQYGRTGGSELLEEWAALLLYAKCQFHRIVPASTVHDFAGHLIIFLKSTLARLGSSNLSFHDESSIRNHHLHYPSHGRDDPKHHSQTEDNDCYPECRPVIPPPPVPIPLLEPLGPRIIISFLNET